MKIGHYTGNIWAQGGIASYIRRISGVQTAQGHEVFFFDTVRPLKDGKPVEGAVVDGIHYVDDDTALLKLASQMQLDLLHLHTTLRSDLPAPLPLLRTVLFHRPYCPSGSRFLKRQEVECNRNYSVAGCLWGHLVDHCGSVRPNKLRDEFAATRYDLTRLDRIHSVAISEFVKTQMLRAGYPESLVHVLHLPAPPSVPYVAPPQMGTPRFLFMGRLIPSKGLEWLLYATQLSRGGWHLDVAGAGPDETAMRELAEKLELANRVTFHGWVDGEKTNALFESCLATVMPSIWHEPAGQVHSESAAHGRATVLSNVGGMPDYAALYKHAVLVPTRNRQALADTLDTLAANVEKTIQMGWDGYDSIQTTHGLPQHMVALHELYERAITDFEENQ